LSGLCHNMYREVIKIYVELLTYDLCSLVTELNVLLYTDTCYI